MPSDTRILPSQLGPAGCHCPDTNPANRSRQRLWDRWRWATWTSDGELDSSTLRRSEVRPARRRFIGTGNG